MAARSAVRTLPDTYFRLVREFPLTRVRDDAHLDDCLAGIARLLGEDQDDGAREYLDALTDLVETYEDSHAPIPDAPGADVLRELMRSRGIGQSALARQVGISQSTISAVLNGTRKLTADHAVALGKFFGVSPAAFLPAA